VNDSATGDPPTLKPDHDRCRKIRNSSARDVAGPSDDESGIPHLDKDPVRARDDEKKPDLR
jgi:hypothetical protein